jgi:Xaa-Pro dipeptidase
MLSLQNCRGRQQRLLDYMQNARLDQVVLANPKTIYYFSGSLTDPAFPQIFAIDSSGRSVLITNQEPRQTAASRVDLYTAYTIDRPFNRTSMTDEAAALLKNFVRDGAAGIESDFAPDAISQVCGAKKENITPAIDQMRRIKDPDEVESIRDTIRLAEAGFTAVRGRLEPGMTEWEVYSIFHQALVAHAQTSVDLRGDFAAGARAIRGGGPPTSRKLAAGDLYILDIFPLYNGYHCDITRTFVVGRPSALQYEAWQTARQAHDLAARVIRPGVAGKEVYQQVRDHLDRFLPARGSFWHHLGHGLGMNGWEFPWLTPGSDQVIQEGEVLAVEPGVYGERLNGGVRLEHDYLVGKDGISPLDSFPLDL